jgi:polar amino acid transport system substrate-binding protein
MPIARAAVVAICVLALGLWATAVRAQEMAPDIKRIVDRGELVVAMYYRDTPPFYFQDDDGQMAGFDVRLIRSFAEHMGVAVSFNRTARSFEEVVDVVARDEADVAISKLSRTFTRSMRVRFTRPYLMLRQGLLVNRLELARQAERAPPELAIRNLRGRIGVIAGSAYEEFARERFPLAEVVGFSSWDEIIAAAARGDLVAAFRDEVEIKKIIRFSSENLIHFQTVVLSDSRDPIAIAVHHQSPNLLALLESYLDDLALEVTADSILDEYMPVRTSPRRRVR